MKLQINTSEKLIRLEESVKLGELFTQLEELLPDMKWREYTLEIGVIHNITVTPLPFERYTPKIPEIGFPWITYQVDTNKSNIT